MPPEITFASALYQLPIVVVLGAVIIFLYMRREKDMREHREEMKAMRAEQAVLTEKYGLRLEEAVETLALVADRLKQK